MPAYLQQVTPGQAGARFELSETVESLIGRANDCGIQVDDLHCSRRHCRIVRCSEGWQICDNQSRHGTFVNGSNVSQRILTSGDRLDVGRLTFYFLEHDDGKGLQLPVEQRTRKTGSFRTTMTLRVDADRFLTADLLPTVDGKDRTSRDLALLYRAAAEIGRSQSVRELLEVLLTTACHGTDVKSGAVLLTDDRGEWTLDQIHQFPPEAIRHIMAYTGFSESALSTGEAIVTTELSCPTPDDPNLDDVARSIDSVLCAPMTSPQGRLGVIHLYRRSSEPQFTEEDVQLVLALATHAGSALESLRLRENLERQNLALRAVVEHSIIGSGDAMAHVKEAIARSAAVDSTVLIRGESGTGKELVARGIHESSPRRSGPMVTLNCAAVPEALLESELFGHEKGAFTGADRTKPGKFEAAEEGSLFLDEIGDMSLASQAKLLRAIETREYQRVGAVRTRKANVRLIAATNQDLEQAVREGTFREDLYYRLTPIQIFIPPLRERKEDIPELVAHFLAYLQQQTGRRCRGLSPEAETLVATYHWPGNVRQLRNAIERAIVMSQSDWVQPADLGIGNVAEAAGSLMPQREVSMVTMAECERQHILAVYEAVNKNKQQTARILGIHRSTLYAKLREYEIET